MTIPQKNSRTIVVDDIRYRHEIRDSGYGGVRVVVEVDGIKLQITLP
ncbi:MAG: hypothetical protein AAGA16_25635 [Cyanobacteria bacterium P01_E01_bin.35]